ncbi:MAG: hypothetical protein LBK72_11405, partial [Bifidobacteriaceae bacterium]|nr:hypothetical protein [Bifidobacteriaceae bacterium]
MVATPALAAQTDQEIDQTVATYDSLVDIVTAEVASAYSGVITTINDLVTGAVNSAIGNPQAVLNLATPLLKASIKGAIGQYIQDDRIDAVIDAAVERIATSTLMEVVLTNEFVQAVLQRTVRYAVADIVASLGLDADQQATTDSLVSTVWTAPRVTVGTAPTKVKSNLGSPIYTLGLGVNTSYYTYNITAWNQKRVLIANVNDTPKEIQVTGWNNGNIRLLAQGVSVVNAGSKADTVVTTLANLDYFSILLSAGSRALFDEVAERVQAALDSLKPQLLTGLSEGLAGLGINLTLNPADSWIAIGGQIAQTLRDSAGNLLDEALSRLPSVIPVDLFSLDRLRELWSGGVNLADLLGTIGGGVNLTDLLGAITGAGVDLT